MRQIPLEEMNLVQLRGLAQSMGAAFELSDSRTIILASIRDFMAAKVPAPRQMEPLKPADDRFINRPPKFVSSPEDVRQIVAQFTGLRVEFPTPDTWLMTHGKREDSGTLRAPLIDIQRAAQALSR